MKTPEQKALIEQLYKEGVIALLPYIHGPARKHSGRPFKSGNKINTIAGVCTNLWTRELAFTFIDDDSFVNVSQVELPRYAITRL